MSASQDKRKRTQQRADGTERRQVASQKAAKEKKATRTKWIIGSILVVLLVAFIIIGNSNLFYTAQKAVKIGDTSYSVAEFNYEYMSTYQQYSQVYSQYYGSGDACAPSAPYTESEDFETWDDFYKDAAIQSLARKQALCKLAEENDVALTDDEIKEVDDSLAELESMAKQYGYGSASKFLTANYGNGVTEKVARKLMLRDALANKYQTQYQENLNYTDEELQAAYAEGKDDYDSYTFSYYFVQAETESATDEEGVETTTASAESMAAAKEIADQILAKAEGSREQFAAAVTELGAPTSTAKNDEEGNPVLDDEGNPVTEETPAELSESMTMQGSSITSYGMPFGDWLKDAARAEGDMTVVEQENGGYYVVLFEGRDDNSYNTVNVRHILIQAEADKEGNYTDEALAAAKAKIEEIKAEYEAGEQTEDAFAALATQYTTDTGSAENGGLYENVPKGQMIEEFNNWIYDPARQPGDVDIIEDSTYHGYHLMYFVGQGVSYQNVLARNALSSKAMDEFNKSLTADLEYDTLFAMRYAGLK